MVIKSFSDIILLPDRKDVLRVHLYTKLIQHGVRPFENDIDIILELYTFGGYNTAEEQSKFIQNCIHKGLKKSPQSVRNTLSKYVSMGIFDKPKNTHLSLNSKFLPEVDCDKLVLLHKVSHAK